jgi:hypothetical protein
MIDLGRNRERLTAEILTCEISTIVFLQESETSTALLQGLSPWSLPLGPPPSTRGPPDLRVTHQRIRAA